MSISDETLGAYIDGELPAAERAGIEAAIRADAEIALRLDRLRAVQNELQAAFSSTVHEPVPQHLIDAVKKHAPSASVVDLARARAIKNPTQRRWNWGELGAIAATLVVGTVLGYFLLHLPAAGLLIQQQGMLFARGALADALSHQLVREQPHEASVRIGISFRDLQGNFCRTFALHDRNLTGLACRENQGWHVQALARNEPSTGTGSAEPAGSAMPAAVLRAVEAKIVGDPLDAAGELAARRSNWGVH